MSVDNFSAAAVLPWEEPGLEGSGAGEGERRGPADAAARMAALRDGTQRWMARERVRPRVPVGAPGLEPLLGDGWPLGRVAELLGPLSSGRTSAAVATAAAATARGEVVAWIDAADAFDPVTAAAAGVALDRVLWVRPGSVEQAVRAAELVAEVGGFTVVVVDLHGVPLARGGDRGRERTDALRLRLQRATERARLVTLVLVERPWAGTPAGVTLRFGRARPVWGGEGSAPRWLRGLPAEVRAERGGRGAAWMGGNGAANGRGRRGAGFLARARGA